jgi:hypothetical protein
VSYKRTGDLSAPHWPCPKLAPKDLTRQVERLLAEDPADRRAPFIEDDLTEHGGVCDGRPLTLHRQRREAIGPARTGTSYVLTTGTGSGTSPSYIVPIVDRVLRERDREGPRSPRRVRALIL